MSVFVIRAEFGQFTDVFREHGYVGIGWLQTSLPAYTKENIEEAYRKNFPDNPEGNVRINVGQINRFIHDIKDGDIILCPYRDNQLLAGKIKGQFYFKEDNTSKYPYRWDVEWFKDTINRHEFSIPLQNSLRSSLTFFQIKQEGEVYEALGLKPKLHPKAEQPKEFDTDEFYKIIKARIKELDAYQFEELSSYILQSLGFTATQKTGKVGDGGIDFEGVLEVNNVAQIQLQVQVKQYESGIIGEKEIRNFRGALKRDFQGTFITLSDFNKKARESANDENKVTINLINGKQFIDLYIEQYDKVRELMLADDRDDLLEVLRFKKMLFPE